MGWVIGIGKGMPFRMGGRFSFDASEAPSGLTLTVIDDTTIKLDWTVNSTRMDGHRIYYSTDGTNFTEKGTVTGTTATYNATGLSAYTRYYFKVVAYKGSIESEASSTANDWTAWKAVLTKQGGGSGVATVRFYFTSTDVVATLDGSGRFYSDSGGTLDESTSYTFTAGALRIRYIKVTSGTSNLLVFQKGNWYQFGTTIDAGYSAANSNAPSATFTFDNMPSIEYIYCGNYSNLINALPPQLKYFVIIGLLSITWTGSGVGVLPSSLLNIEISSSISLTIQNIPTTVTKLYLEGVNVSYTRTTPFHNGITYLYLSGANLNWTGLAIGDTGNVAVFNLGNYRISKMSSADMVTFLTNLTNRTGTLPATITINDYADYASPPTEVVNAVNALKATKSVTTVNLGA